MNKDIRIDLSFSNHRKRKKLFSILGAQGVLSLIDLWLKTAESRPKGILTGMDETDIALDAQWSADAGQFCKVLCEVGFLDRAEDGTYSIHDWKEHQRYAYFSEERSKVARDSARRRWEKRRGIKKEDKEKQGHNANIMQGAYEGHTKGNAPSPSPNPNPNPLNTSLSSSKMTCPHPDILELYHKILPELPPVKVWSEERQKHLRARWKEEPKRRDLEWWRKYFEYVRESSFLMGNGNKKWQPNLEWLVKKSNLINVIEGKYHQSV